MTNEYADIDIDPQNATIAELRGPDAPAAVARVLAAPQHHAPPVLMLAGSLLFAAGRREAGAFWFYAGQLRARVDAARCTNASAGAACEALRSGFGPPINHWALREPGLLPGLVERVVAWDTATHYDYDHRWIALHGMGAYGVGGDETPLSVPAQEWPAIVERTRAELLDAVVRLYDADGRLRTELFD